MKSSSGIKSAVLIILAAAMTIAVLAPSAEAKRKKKPKKQKKEKILFIGTDLKFTYDNNIINYSDADLDLYDTGGDTSKFAIESKDDFIISPKVDIRLKGNFIAHHTAWIGTNITYYYYVQNEIRRFQKYSLFARQYVGNGKYLEAEYAYIPDYYYRNQFYQGTFVEASFSKHYLKFEAGAQLFPSLNTTLAYRRQMKYFNAEVSERDLTVNGVRAEGVWRASKSLKFWLYYGFEAASAAGADNPSLDVKDVSYDAWDITLGGRYYSRLLGKLKPQLVSTLQFREITFVTNKYLDIYRFDRNDHNLQFRVGTAVQAPWKTRVDLDYVYKQKRADLPIPSLESLLNYNSYSISLTLRRDF